MPKLTIYALTPKETPEGADLFLASNINDWRSDDQKFKFVRLSDRLYKFELTKDKNYHLEFKITRGSWESEENYFNNRHFTFDENEKVIELTIDKWKDINDKFTLDFVSNKENYYLVNKDIKLDAVKELIRKDWCIYHIEEITFEDESPRKEAFENVLSSLRIDGINFLYLITGDKQGVHFYFGVVKNLNENCKLALEVNDIGTQILKPSINGNFRGSKITDVPPDDRDSIIDKVRKMKYFGFLEGVPGINEDNEDTQGVDRLIDVMLGDDFGVAIISKPLNLDEISGIEKRLFRAYNGIAPLSKRSIQEGNSTNDSLAKSVTQNTSDTKGKNYSEGKTEGTGKNEGESSGKNKSTTKGTSKPSGGSSNSTSESDSGTEGSSDGKNWGTSESKSTSITSGTSCSTTSGKSVSDSTTKADSKSISTTVEFSEKEAQEWLKYLDEAILPRLDYGKSKGLFISSAFIFAETTGNLVKLGNTMRALFSGKSGNKVPLELKILEKNDTRLLPFFKNFQLPSGLIENISTNEEYARAALSQYTQSDKVQMGNWISTNELSLIAGLPQKEVVGLGLKEEVEFGLNVTPCHNDQKIHLGKLVQNGRLLETVDIHLDRDNLNKHIFITGVTGSGKTTTCHKLLNDSEMPFLVIEPAKTEYRVLTKDAKFKNMLIFTLGNNNVAPFKLNPFEFFPHESITSRADMIKASLEASFDMEAAIPQILEAAIYRSYENYGWNIASNKNSKYPNPHADGIYAFPTLEDLVFNIAVIVKEQGFDDRLKNDYIGSIKARLQGLLIGSKGLMLNTKRSINFKELIKRQVVLELEEIKSGNEKSLIMGFILTNLVEAIKAEHKENRNFKHITLVEEAHRLLSRYMPGDSQNKKQGVEVFSDMLAEVRKYGESLIIVDQIPNKLTPEVLKNTNTKIVHKIFAEDDKEAIGNTMALKEEQKDFLSNLEVGRAIVFTQGFNKPLQVQITKTSNTTGEEEISDDVIRRNILKFYQQCYKSGVIQGLENFPQEPTLDDIKAFYSFLEYSPLSDEYRSFIVTYKTKFDFEKELNLLNKKYSLELLADYLTKKFYIEEQDFTLQERYAVVIELLKKIITGSIKKTLESKFIDTLIIRR